MRIRTIRLRVGHRAIFAGSLFSALLVLLSFAPTFAATGINQQISYQARLLDNTGAAVPDGTYNMEFKIYQDGNGVLGGGDETLKWTETRTSGNKVTVKNGYFSVMLGFVNSFGSSVDWNQDTLWLSTNIGGTGTPTWDGEMTPFRRFGAAAYALNANQLGGLSAANFLQIAPGAVQSDTTTASSIFLNKTGASGNILQLQKNGVDVLSINNSGLATFSSGVSVAGDTITDFTGNGLSVSANSLTVRLDTTAADGSTTSSVSGLEFASGELSLIRGCNAGQVLQWDNTNFEWDCGTVAGGSGYATIQDETTPLTQRATVNFTGAGVSCADNVGATRTDCTIASGGVGTIGTLDSQTKSANSAVISGSSLVMQTADGSSPGVVSTGTQTFAGAKTLTGAATFQNTSNSTTAFRVLNASVVPLFVIDTTNSYVYVGNPAADGTAALLILDSKNTSGDPTGTIGAMYYNSADNKFRCHENTAWWDCVGVAGDRSRRKPVYSTDFLGPAGAATLEATDPWDIALLSSGTQAKIAAEPSHPGILRISSSTTANSGGLITTDPLSNRLAGSEAFECVFQPRVASNTNTTLRMGYLDATTSADAVDGVYFELPPGSLNIVGKTSSNSVRTTSATVAALTVNTWYRAKLEVNSNATSVTFSIYNDANTLLGSQAVSTNIPTAAGRETGNGVVVTNSSTTATLLAYIDYLSMWQERVLAR